MRVKKFILGDFAVNTYLLINGNNAIVIDPGQDFLSVIDEVKKYNIEAVLITHIHLDHFDGVGYFNCPIYLGNENIPYLEDDTVTLYKYCKCNKSYDINKLNIKTFKDNEIINLPSFTVKTIYTPGHSIGSYCFLINNCLFSGDTLFKGSCGRTDLPSGSLSKIQKSLHHLKEIIPDNTIIYPGHDEITNMKDEKKSNSYLK